MKKVSRVSKKFILYSLSLVVAFFCFFSLFRNGKELFHYLGLSESALVEVDAFSIHEVKRNHYQIWGSALLPYHGVVYKVTAPLPISYPNPWAAENRIRQLEREGKMKVELWFSPHRIEEARFIHNFPLHSLLSSLILAGILLYFCGIALYFRKKGYQE